MRLCQMILLAIVGSLLASCAAKNDSVPAPPPVEAQPKVMSSSANSSVAQQDAAPPKDAQWTIYCWSIKGPNHVAQANELKANLLRTSSLRGWYVVHQEDHSALYYGYYRSFKNPKDPKETQRLQGDQKAIQAIADSMGDRPFREAMPMLIVSPDPLAPPEWDLKNARGAWSLEIAVYLGSPQRKQAAIDAVREARKQGIEAYYFHGPNVSSVCIGAWPASAVQVHEPTQYLDEDREQPVLVVGPGAGAVSPGAKGVIDRNTNKQLKVLENNVEIVDPALAAMMKQYPHHILNGSEEIISIRGRDGRTIDQPKTSMIVPIPQRQVTELAPSPTPEQPNSRILRVDPICSLETQICEDLA